MFNKLINIAYIMIVRITDDGFLFGEKRAL